MARRRHQDPRLERKGNFWWARIYRDVFVDGTRIRQRQRIKIAPATMGKREAEKVKDEIVGKENRGLITVGSAVNFSDYVITEYKPTQLRKLASSTQASYEAMLTKYLLPAFGQLCLRDLTRRTLDRFFVNLASEGVAYPTLVKLRDTLSSVLRQAKADEFIVDNPLHGLNLPPDRREEKHPPFLTPQQFSELVEVVAEPYATMLYVAVWTGLRVSELIGLRWANIQGDTISIKQRFCRGDWSRPKTKASAATIAVETHVIERIERLKTLTVNVRAGRALREYQAVKRCGPDDLVFQSLRNSGPMNDQNILKRHIQPAAKRLGFYANWRSLRTSHATWLIQAGADVKSVQGQMRHSRIQTTLDIYAQIVPQTQRQALRKLTEFAQGNRVPLVQ